MQLSGYLGRFHTRGVESKSFHEVDAIAGRQSRSHLPKLALRVSSPDSVSVAVFECFCEAFGLYWAGSADAFGCVGVAACIREEEFGVCLCA